MTMNGKQDTRYCNFKYLIHENTGSYPKMFCKKKLQISLKTAKFRKIQRKIPMNILLFSKVSGSRPATLLKSDLVRQK